MLNGYMSKSSEAVKRWRTATKQRIVDALGGQCCVCGYSRCLHSLAPHHLDPSEKEFSFGAIRGNPISWTRIVEELRKCILLCNNCHGEFHAGLIELPLDAPRFNESYTAYKLESVMDVCWVCGGQKLQGNKTCSRKCARKIQRRLAGKSGLEPELFV